jgi:type I restriction enzyme S subunit
MNWADQEYVLGRGIAAIRHQKDQRLQPLVRAAIEEQLPELLQAATGSTFPNVSRAQLAELDFPRLAPQAELAVAELLGQLDAKIELNRRMNQTLEAMARAIFRDWFVDFGPTRTKLDGRGAYIAPEIWAIFPDDVDGDGLPAGWRTCTLSEIADLNPESWSSQEHPNQVRYVELSNAKWGEIESVQQHDWEQAPSRARRVLRAGDTIFGTVRPANGSFALIGREGLTGSTGFAVLRPKQVIDREIVWCATTAPENVERLASLADGAAYPAVRPELVANTPVALAPKPIRHAFSSVVAPLVDRAILNRAETETLRDTRDALVPQLMSGELSVSSFDSES